MKKYLLSVIVLLFLAFASHAQSDLEIRHAFDKYGKVKGSVLVELKGEVLKGYDFHLFRSLSISNNAEAADFIRKCLANDEVGARKVKQVVANGKPTSIYLQLPQQNNMYRLVLFNETTQPTNQITLIYIESKIDSEDVLKLILKKK